MTQAKINWKVESSTWAQSFNWVTSMGEKFGF